MGIRRRIVVGLARQRDAFGHCRGEHSIQLSRNEWYAVWSAYRAGGRALTDLPYSRWRIASIAGKARMAVHSSLDVVCGSVLHHADRLPR